MIDQEARFDGFNGICTDLDDIVPEIIKVNGGRWIIEGCVRKLALESGQMDGRLRVGSEGTMTEFAPSIESGQIFLSFITHSPIAYYPSAQMWVPEYPLCLRHLPCASPQNYLQKSELFMRNERSVRPVSIRLHTINSTLKCLKR